MFNNIQLFASHKPDQCKQNCISDSTCKSVFVHKGQENDYECTIATTGIYDLALEDNPGDIAFAKRKKCWDFFDTET